MRSVIFLFIFCIPIANANAAWVHISSGTGFYVTSRYIITNAHVVRQCKEILLQGAVEDATATVFAVDSKEDLAILETTTPPTYLASLRANEGLKKGDMVHMIGYPNERSITGEYQLKRAHIVDLKNGKIEFSDPVQQGNSGGPLLDRSGNVIGVVVGRLSYYHYNPFTGKKAPDKPPLKVTGLAIGLDAVRSFLSQYNIRSWAQTTYDIFSDYKPDIRAKQYIVNIHCIQGLVESGE